MKYTKHSAWHSRRTRYAAPSGAEGRRQKGRDVSGDAIMHGDGKTHEAQRAARSAHPLQRGAEWGRG